ncbi:MAG: FG-GAP repeat domain-containing protein, partial [Planctomycetia bacterium]
LGNGNGTFKPKTDFATGANPRSGTLGDVNGDGRLDIITANYGSNNTSVLLGNGNGTFGPKTDFATGVKPNSVTLGDVNRDGRLDIVTANRGSSNVSVLLANGGSNIPGFDPSITGSFASLGFGVSPRDVQMADVNGDGNLDIVTANISSLKGSTASVLLGNGNGTFGPKADFATGDYPNSVTLGDVNGDGRLDIITANRISDSASVLLGNGNGTFSPKADFATGTNPKS